MIGVLSVPLAAAGLAVKFQVYWRADAGDDKHYLVYQANLSDAASGRFIALCTYYEADDQAVFFPVGACSGPGDVPASGEGYTVVGATFTRH